MNSYPHTKALRAQLAENLRDFDCRETIDPALKRAAVALVVVEHQRRACVLLTLRAARLGRHSGQYALPGGRVDAGEASEQAARRELGEELGLALAPQACLGRLDDYPTRSGFCISPYVYWADEPLVLAPSAAEVAQVYRVPLAELDSDAIPHFEAGADAERPVLYSRLPSVGERMYAPTAALMYQFREVALRGLRTRVAHFDQPAFAWR